ncbi:hypothetical protein Syun_022678 [Stephania yunnanensis]|uniref:65-kDa microtubule-associated protein 6 n=1 Tax=Stephania yunnanensis TaxID=152371 RepID=A0AAP0FF09_9MAGN
MQGLGVRTMDTGCCGALLRELQSLWDEIGESEADQDCMLAELERECLGVYRRKVEEASTVKARIHQSLASREAELATLVAALGEHSLHSPERADASHELLDGNMKRMKVKSQKRMLSLKEQLASITPLVEDLRRKKEERLKQFKDVKAQIEKISGDILGLNHANDDPTLSSIEVDEHDLSDLSVRKLNEYKTRLQALKKEKSDRLHKVLEHVNEVHSLCGVLGLDFGKTVNEVHPSLHEAGLEQSTNISNKTLKGLEQAIHKLKLEKRMRIQKLNDIFALLTDLWNLMDSPEEERSRFRKIKFVLNTPESEITESGVLSLDIIEQATVEVERLTKLKASRMKELVFKRRLELEETCRKAHIEPDMSTSLEKANAMIDSGLVDPSELLANIEAHIEKAKEEARTRKEIMDRVDKWLAVCEEESWLEEYNQDENRYNAGRGAHLNLKRAERARVTISKIPAIVDNLLSKTLAWENERKTSFLYDGVRLVSLLEDYKISRKLKEEEKRRFRDQKKLQDLLITEKELMYGSKPSPRRTSSFRGTNGYRPNGNGSMPPTPRRLSAGCATPELLTPRSRSGRQNGYFREGRRLSTAPLNFVSVAKEDAMSYASISGSEPGSPPLDEAALDELSDVYYIEKCGNNVNKECIPVLGVLFARFDRDNLYSSGSVASFGMPSLKLESFTRMKCAPSVSKRLRLPWQGANLQQWLDAMRLRHWCCGYAISAFISIFYDSFASLFQAFWFMDQWDQQ